MGAGLGEAIVPVPLLKKPPQAMGIETRGVTAAADGFDRLMEAGRLKDAGGLMRSVGRPAHSSQRERKLIVVAMVDVRVAENGGCQLMRSIFSHARVGRGYADTRPTGRSQNGLGNGFMVDSHRRIGT